MTPPPMKYAEAPGIESSAAEMRPPVDDSETATVSRRATRRAATEAARDARRSGTAGGRGRGGRRRPRGPSSSPPRAGGQPRFSPGRIRTLVTTFSVYLPFKTDLLRGGVRPAQQ